MEREYVKNLTLVPCQRCGSDCWRVWVCRNHSCVTAYAACGECDALYFTWGGDTSRKAALENIQAIINGGHKPYF